MQRKRRKSKILIVLLIVLLIVTGCKKDEKNLDAIRFKEEFEIYNDTLSKLDISEDNPFVYTNDVYNLVENEKALVLFYANPKDENSRNIVESIIEKAKSSKLNKIYYIKMDENDNNEVGGVKIEKTPTLVSIIRKEVKETTSEKEKINLIIDPVVQELSTCDIDVGC